MNSFSNNSENKIVGRSGFKNRPIIKDDNNERIIYVTRDEWKYHRMLLKEKMLAENINVIIKEDKT